MSRQRRLWVVLLLNLLLIAALVIVGLRAHSLGVLAAGADYLADAAAIGVSLFAIWLARRPPSSRRPDGYSNATTVAALVNSGWLLVLSVLVIGTAIQRLVAGAPTVAGLPVLIVSAIAAVVMLIGALILGGDLDDDDSDDADDADGDGHGGGDRAGDGDALNVRAVLLDTAADAAAAGGVAVSGAVILSAGGLYWLDPAVALIIAAVVGYHALKLTRKVVATLLRSGRRRSRSW